MYARRLRTLRERLERGETADVFASANMEHPLTLARQGKAGPVVLFARNELCALAREGLAVSSATVLDVMLDPATKLATSTPKADPSGDYAWEVFRKAELLRSGSQQRLEQKALQLTGGPNALSPPAGMSVSRATASRLRLEFADHYLTPQEARMAVNPLSRREVIKFGAFTTVGGVMTPGISLAQAIVTDTKDIAARDIQINVGGTMIPGYDARPEAQGRYPIVLAISGFTGLNEQHKDVVRRFAHAGYYAIAPELFHREGGMQGKAFPELAKISAGIGRKQYLGDLTAAADFAKQQAWARPDRLGVTGFCGGGALTLHFAAEYPGVTAAVPWYGHVKRVYNDAPGVDAFAIAPKIKAPVLGLYGEADTGIPPADVKAFETELKKTNPNVEFVLYPGAPHAFFSDDRPQVYKKDAADDAWKRCLAFFDKHLKA